jgi:hypothetical protein
MTIFFEVAHFACLYPNICPFKIQKTFGLRLDLKLWRGLRKRDLVDLKLWRGLLKRGLRWFDESPLYRTGPYR